MHIFNICSSAECHGPGTMAAPPATAGAPQFASLYVGDLHPYVTEAASREGGGDGTLGSPHRAQMSQFELFEFCSLIEVMPYIINRTIRGSSISINSTLPPLT